MQDFIVFNRHLFYMFHFVRGVLLTLLLILLGLGLITARVDDLSLAEGLYFAFITGLTIGYGDITPASGVTQIISVLSGVVGVIFVGILVAVSVRALEYAVNEKKLSESTKATTKESS